MIFSDEVLLKYLFVDTAIGMTSSWPRGCLGCKGKKSAGWLTNAPSCAIIFIESVQTG